jgi:FkbM family methyltransferase
MDLLYNDDPCFTKWLVRAGLLRESFVLIDVGVLGGENPRWHVLGDHLIVHGFDAIKEKVDELAKTNKAATRTYHALAIGDEDGEREFYFKPSNPSNSSFFESFFLGTARDVQARLVPVRRLDTLLREGVIPRADFLKVDVEGFELDVLRGGSALLAGVLGVEAETNFSASEARPESPFAVAQKLLLRDRLILADLNFDRIPRASYHEACRLRGQPGLGDACGKPTIFNVLFCRDLAAERDSSRTESRPNPSVDQVLKSVVIYELFGLNDIAVDTIVKYSAALSSRVDIDRAVDLLCQQDAMPLPSDTKALRQLIQSIYASKSWRMTAPLRAVSNALKRSS